MAVASDLPDLENRKEYQDARNSVLVDAHGQPLGILTSNQSRVLVPLRATSSPSMTQRDHRDRGPALLHELGRRPARHRARARRRTCSASKAAQGGSTITQQFVKNALAAQDNRTVFEKLREAALAYHLTRKWSKEQDPHAST